MTLLELEPNSLASDSFDENEIAGYDPNAPLQLEQDYQLTTDHEQPTAVPPSEQGFPRFLLTSLVVGLVFLGTLGFYLALKPKQPQPIEPTFPQSSTTDSLPTAPDPTEDFNAQAEIALMAQTHELNPEPEEAEPGETTVEGNVPSIELEPETPPTVTQPASVSEPTVVTPPPRPVTTTPPPKPTPPQPAPTRPTPPPKPIQPPSLPQPTQSVSPPNPTPVPPPSTETASKLTPFEYWLQLANVGQSGEIPDPNPEPPLAAEPISPQAELVTFSDSDESLSVGAQGILTRTHADTVPQTPVIPFGTLTPGTVSVPLIWDSTVNADSQQTYNRFAITLTENILATNGEVALPTGTILIATAESVNESQFVQATAIAAVYSHPPTGEIQQKSLPPGQIVIRAENGQPLIAQSHFQSEGQLFQQDLLISVLSGLGRVGEVLTQPETTSTISSQTSGGTVNSTHSTVTQQGNPQIWAAVVDGFFNPLSERIAERSQGQIDALENRPNLAVVPQDTPVSVTFVDFVSLR